ncbi:MAG TPA: diiron oxygenase, partial [Acidimicrobiia bacterium]|nr:diiron oxygenase [Acidimicrobiia bacterium]
ARVERLNVASRRRVIEPDLEVAGSLTKDQVVADDLLSVVDLDLDLTPAQRARLAREEVASIARFGILFEAVLMSGFAYRLALTTDVTDPRFTYVLHEIGEESRHSRLFVRLVDQLAPSQRDPFNSRVATRIRARLFPLLVRRPATFDAFVLAGEEIPDLFQKLAADHPATDDFVRAVSRYHRLEEARHLAFARTAVGEHYRETTWTDRFALRWIVPIAIVTMFDTIVQPFVYATVGLPVLSTWLRVRRQPARVALRRECVRAVLRALTDADVFPSGRVPMLWRQAAAVDRAGVPRPPAVQRGVQVLRASAAQASRRALATACTVRRPVQQAWAGALDAQDRVTAAASTCWRLTAWIRA